MITNKNLIEERTRLGGIQRIYRVGDYGLSVVNSPILHSYRFAWETAVLKFNGEGINDFKLDYSTPLTNDIEVFFTDKETNEFLKKAFIYFKKKEK